MKDNDRNVYPLEGLLIQLTRIATAQEALLQIAQEARKERLELADKLKQRFSAGFQGRESSGA